MKVKRQHKDATKNFDNKTIADRLRRVSWSHYCHSTGVAEPVLGEKDKPSDIDQKPPFGDRK